MTKKNIMSSVPVKIDGGKMQIIFSFRSMLMFPSRKVVTEGKSALVLFREVSGKRFPQRPTGDERLEGPSNAWKLAPTSFPAGKRSKVPVVL